MTTYHRILSKTDRALVAYLVSLGAGTTEDTYPAKRSGDKLAPCTICHSEHAAAIGKTGSYTVSATVEVKTLAPVDAGQDEAAPQDQSEARVGAVFDAFFTILDGTAYDSQKVASQITAAARELAASEPAHNGDLADYTALDCRVLGVGAGREEEGEAWVDTLGLEIDAAPSDVD